MKKIDIAKKYNVSNSFVTDISKHRRHTKNKDLALHIAAIMGDYPISYISPEIRDAYKKAYPVLSKKVKEVITIEKK